VVRSDGRKAGYPAVSHIHSVVGAFRVWEPCREGGLEIRDAPLARGDVLKWLRASSRSWSADTCSAAARGRHLATVQRADGCLCDADACRKAAAGTYACCSGRARTAAHGTGGHARAWRA
jgi:hypothetical protein